MADAITNAFEIERRAIMWTPLITLNDGITALTWDADPNTVVDGNSSGETWLYSLPVGHFYKQTDSTLWWKTASPNTWEQLISSSEGTLTTSDIIIPDGVGSPSYDDVQDFLNNTQSSGRLTGGVVTEHAGPDGTVDISEMEGFIYTTEAVGADYIYFKQAAESGLSLSDNAVNWIYFDWNGGSPRYAATTDRSTVHEYDQFIVSRVFREGTSVEIGQTPGMYLPNYSRRMHDRLILKYGHMDRISGGHYFRTCYAFKIAN